MISHVSRRSFADNYRKSLKRLRNSRRTMESDKEVTRARQKLTAAFRAQFSLKQRFEKIDFELDVIKPRLKELDNDLTKGVLPEVSIEWEDLTPRKALKS